MNSRFISPVRHAERTVLSLYPAVLYQTSGESRSNTTWLNSIPMLVTLRYYTFSNCAILANFPNPAVRLTQTFPTTILAVCVILSCISTRCNIDQFISNVKTMRRQYTYTLCNVFWTDYTKREILSIWQVILL